MYLRNLGMPVAADICEAMQAKDPTLLDYG